LPFKVQACSTKVIFKTTASLYSYPTKKLFMLKRYRNILPVAFLIIYSCSGHKPDPTKADVDNDKSGQEVNLPAPYATKAVRNFCKVIGWAKGTMPKAPAGFRVSLFADSLNNPRNIYVAPNGDVFAAQATTEAKGLRRWDQNWLGRANPKIWVKAQTTLSYSETRMATACLIREVFS
jgi:glucose/arabinose dehydrogenase